MGHPTTAAADYYYHYYCYYYQLRWSGCLELTTSQHQAHHGH